jgi:CheY-like chemotaxis protein
MSPKRKKETHILVVDDQRDIAEFLRTTLEAAEQGYAVACVPSGEEALLEIQRQTFALVVVDYRLPGMTGLELIRHIQKRSKTTRFLLVTGYDIEEERAELDRLGVTEVLGKPIDLEVFTTAVEAAIKGERRPPKAVQEAPIVMLDFDEGLVFDYISALQLDLGAIAVLFADRAGAIRLEKGSVGSRELGDLGGLLAESFITSVGVSSWVSDGPPSFVHYYDGSRYDIYTLAVDASYFMIVIYPGNAQTKLGPVLSYGRRTVKKILSALGGKAPAVDEGVEAEELVEAAAEEEMAAELAEAAEPEYYEEEVLEAEEGEEGERLNLEGLEIDLETLEEIDSMFDEGPPVIDQGTLEEIDAMLGSAEAEELNHADAYWDEATREETAAADGTLSREEAIKRGLIPDDLSPPE